MTQLLKIVVMSDLHLMAAGRVKFDIDTAARFDAALQSAARLHADADLCVFAGDIADSAEPEAYALFEAMRKALPLPQRVMLGNHDDREVYLAGAVDPMVLDTGEVAGSVDLKGHRIVMLDTARAGVTEGFITDTCLDWCAAELAEAARQSLQVIVILHHEPIALQMPVDTYRLQEPEELRAVLDASGADIRMVMAGHCHVASAGSWGGYPIVTIPGNQHLVEPYLRGRTGQQACYVGPAQYAVLVSDGVDTAVHFQRYTDDAAALPEDMFPWKRDQPFADL